MRYFKGFIVISSERDLPVLIHIRNARAISFRQLRLLLFLEGIEKTRRSADWRVTRLQHHGLVERIEEDGFLGEPFFVITANGLRVLESRGHSLVSLPSSVEQIIHHSQVPHAIELMRIRLALAQHGILRSWLSELEVSSRNTVLPVGEAKDYDAVAEMFVDGQLRTVGIEYERTAKSASRYREIRQMLDRDKSVDVALYLASDRNVLYLLADEMRTARKRVGIALSDSFRQNPLDANTLLSGEESEVVPFRTIFAAPTVRNS
jgi:hypothetical protein